MNSRKDPIAWRPVHGILLLDKPKGMTSNQALQSTRRMFAAEKGGHTGSLDPLATGLLPICFGEATKIAGYLLGAAKAYEAQVCLGITTTTADADGEVLQLRRVPALDVVLLENELSTLRGRIRQIPPVYSAIKQGGVPLYKRARAGQDVQAPPREVEISRLDLLGFTETQLRLHVECSSGTYVRSLATDLGEKLGCGAHLTGLRRLWVDPFLQPCMHSLESLAAIARDGDQAALDALLLKVDDGLAAFPSIEVDVIQAQALRLGQPVGCGAEPQELCRVLESDHLIALGKIDQQGVLRVTRGLNLPR
ncbi:MAG: tRNA pseudouridine(55) synthase TruB [Tahibacter sp.]